MEERRFTEEVFRIRITIKVGEWKVHVLRKTAFLVGKLRHGNLVCLLDLCIN